MCLCINFRHLSFVTKIFHYPMENISELINRIDCTNIITCLDVLKGYWKIPLEEQSRDLILFKTHCSQYQWKIMLFGLRNVSATFQKVMNEALNQHCDHCKAYLDDIDWNTRNSQ